MYFEVGLGADVTLAEVKDDEGMVTASTKFGADYIYSSEQMVASDVKVTLRHRRAGGSARHGPHLGSVRHQQRHRTAAPDLTPRTTQMDMLVKAP